MFDHPKLKLMIDPAKIEQGAVSQIAQCLGVDALEKLVICPDVHQGYDIPIGAAALIRGYIWPGAVGYDINCVDCDTEFLSPKGWVRMDSYSGQKVMQFNPFDKSAEFVDPLKYIVEDCKEFLHFKTRSVDQMLSPKHRCLVYKFDREYKFNNYEVESAESIFKKHARLKIGYRDRFMTAFSPKLSTSLPLNDNDLRVMVMVSADSNLTKERARLRLVKTRKINRAKNLLANCGIKFNEYPQKDGATLITFVPPIYEKGLENFWMADAHQLAVIVDEVFHWDGNIESQCFFSRRKEEADFVQYAISATGRRASLIKDTREDGGIDYRVFAINNPLVGIYGSPKTEMNKVQSADGKMYCFTVPSSFLVLRRGGHVFITGNCGMCFINTGYTLGQLELLKMSDRVEFFEEMRRIIPTNADGHQKAQGRYNKFPNGAGDKHYEKVVLAKASEQLMTLGGGK